MHDRTIAILGAGNIGRAIARGLADARAFAPERIALTRRNAQYLDDLKPRGFRVGSDNRAAVRGSDIVIVAVEPRQIDGVLDEIAAELTPGRHVLISVVTGVSSAHIAERTGGRVPIVRAMPNTAIAVRQSMTCLAADGEGPALEAAKQIFDAVGTTVIIEEAQMSAATALVACGIAFFLRAIRAASQGGIEIGFHSEDALAMAAQTARGAATLLLAKGDHPEHEIDRVTTPRGCTIAGLNQLEHEGFSSAMIKGITTSARMAAQLYSHRES
uniref:Pyrroline-5-carboxylate reductase n=1 Tax=Eiseniibacteriota bacterium TaxID=2212470 RepID=A0A832I5J3_UNCEI